MHPSIFFRKVLSKIFYRTGLCNSVFRRFGNSGNFLILMYHRVVYPDDGIEPGMYVHPITLEKHVRLLSKYFNIVSLKNLPEVSSHSTLSSCKPFCAITFDDGWKDFYNNAFPILSQYNMPATVFLPTNFIGTCDRFWTDDLSYFLLHYKPFTLTTDSKFCDLDFVNFINKLKGTHLNRLDASIKYLKSYRLENILDVIDNLYLFSNINKNRPKRAFLNWSEVLEMKNSGIVSFGSHTNSHQILTTVTDLEISRELKSSKNILLEKKAVESSFLPFCYPNGNFTEDIASMVKSAGYHLAVTTINSWNPLDHDRYSLKRIGIHNDMTSTTSLFASRIAGLL